MPTRYWLVGRREVLAVSRLEAAGGVRRAEAEIDPAPIADAHRRYAAERDAADPGRPRRTRARRAASAARARASSACTPTTPGSSPAATTRSGAWVARPAGGSARRSRSARSSTSFSRRTVGDVRHPVSDSASCSPRELVDPDPPTPERADQRDRARSSITSTTCCASVPDDGRRRRRRTSAATSCGTVAAVEVGATRRRRPAWSSSATPPRRCSAPSPPSRRADARCTTRASRPTRVDTVLAASCVHRRRGDAPPAPRRRHVDASTERPA